MNDTERARRQRERVERWTGEALPVPTPVTDFDRHVNRAWELARSDNLPRYVYVDRPTGLIFISKALPPESCPKWAVVTGQGYPTTVER